MKSIQQIYRIAFGLALSLYWGSVPLISRAEALEEGQEYDKNTKPQVNITILAAKPSRKIKLVDIANIKPNPVAPAIAPAPAQPTPTPKNPAIIVAPAAPTPTPAAPVAPPPAPVAPAPVAPAPTPNIPTPAAAPAPNAPAPAPVTPAPAPNIPAPAAAPAPNAPAPVAPAPVTPTPVSAMPAPQQQSTLMTGGLSLPDLHKTVRQRKPVRARDLFTEPERIQYRQAMEAAVTPQAQRHLRELTYTRLSRRAWEQGMILIEPGHWITGTRWSENMHMPHREPAHPQHPPHPHHP